MSRFLEKHWKSVSPEPNSGCWLWIGSTTREGYGRAHLRRGKTVAAHRKAFQMDTGAVIPRSMHLDHLCRVRCCVNPDHLEVVTARVNTHRAMLFRDPGLCQQDGLCLHGHPLDQSNAHSRADGDTPCRSCEILSRRRYRARKRLISKPTWQGPAIRSLEVV